jgi:opacity protein-like surface antigen
MRISLFAVALTMAMLSNDLKADDEVRYATSGSSWYAGLSTSYLFAGSDIDVHGSSVSVFGGMPTFELDDGQSIALSAGYRWSNRWRIEGQLGYQRLTSDTTTLTGLDDRLGDTFSLDSDLDSWSLMVNGIYEPDLAFARIRPFVKLGLGVARHRADATLDVQYDAPLWNGTSFEGVTVSDSPFAHDYQTSFAWQAGIGFTTALYERLSLDVEYGFADLGDANSALDENGDALTFENVASQRVSLGLTYRF